jgi:exosortase
VSEPVRDRPSARSAAPAGPPRAARALIALAFAATFAAVFGGTIAGLGREWTSSPDTSYGLILVAVAIGVLWQRRAALAGADAAPAGTAGLAGLSGGLLLYAVGQLGADVFLTRVSMVAILAGTVWFAAGGRAIRAAAAPFVFLLIAIPLPTLVVNAVTLPLQLTASGIAEQTLSAAGVSVFRDGNVLELPSGALEVAEACSGLRSAVSLAAIAVLLAWTQPTWLRRAAIVAASVPIAIVTNGLRITATALAAQAWGPDVATGNWHVFTGWVTFVLSLLALLALQRALGGSPPRPAPLEAVVSA